MRVETLSRSYVYFLMSMNYVLKLLNKSNHMIRMSHVRCHFLWSLRLTKLCPASFRYASSETTNPTSLKG